MVEEMDLKCLGRGGFTHIESVVEFVVKIVVDFKDL